MLSYRDVFPCYTSIAQAATFRDAVTEMIDVPNVES